VAVSSDVASSLRKTSDWTLSQSLMITSAARKERRTNEQSSKTLAKTGGADL